MRRKNVKWRLPNFNLNICEIINFISYRFIGYISTIFLVIILFAGLHSCTTITKVAYDGNLEKVKKFVEQKGANVDENRYFQGATPLMAAANHGHLNVVEYLISKGANVNVQVSGFKLAYSKTISNGNYEFEIVKESNGQTALTRSLYGFGDWVNSCKYLLNKGAKINFQYISRNAEPVIYDYNMAYSCRGSGNIEPTKEQVDTPLTFVTKAYAYWKENDELASNAKSVIEIMIKYGADKKLVDGDGSTAYEIAVKKNLKNLIDILKP